MVSFGLPYIRLIMTYYPIFLDLSGQNCLVVGGGDVAERKVNGLLEAGALVTVVSPGLSAALSQSLGEGTISHINRDYQSGDIEGYRLVIAATDDESINKTVVSDASGADKLVNVVDQTELCSFIVPSVLNRGPLQIAVSTSGQSPLLASRIRRQLEDEFGPEYGDWVSIVGQFRRRLMASSGDESVKRAAYERLLDSDLLDKVRAKELIDIDGLIDELTR